jgi:hypothetical protein
MPSWNQKWDSIRLRHEIMSIINRWFDNEPYPYARKNPPVWWQNTGIRWEPPSSFSKQKCRTLIAAYNTYKQSQNQQQQGASGLPSIGSILPSICFIPALPPTIFPTFNCSCSSRTNFPSASSCAADEVVGSPPFGLLASPFHSSSSSSPDFAVIPVTTPTTEDSESTNKHSDLMGHDSSYVEAPSQTQANTAATVAATAAVAARYTIDDSKNNNGDVDVDVNASSSSNNNTTTSTSTTGHIITTLDHLPLPSPNRASPAVTPLELCSGGDGYN